MNAMSPSPGPLTADHVIDAYLQKNRFVTRALLESPTRVQQVNGARQELMWLLRNLTQLSLPAIGRVFGDRDHKTVVHGIGNVADRIAHDAEYRAQLQRTRAYIVDWRPSSAEQASRAIEAARRVMRDPVATEDAHRLAIIVSTIDAILQSDRLTDPEARKSARAVLQQAEARHG